MENAWFALLCVCIAVLRLQSVEIRECYCCIYAIQIFSYRYIIVFVTKISTYTISFSGKHSQNKPWHTKASENRYKNIQFPKNIATFASTMFQMGICHVNK